ncbi:hypothetical protein LTR53_006693 [Teratosphaeriaceae sp. CCFEE 6253]|nr:hypothetical protein LTR53_006693 [Teratosphaeriaceae sp. CCFEE 6253]
MALQTLGWRYWERYLLHLLSVVPSDCPNLASALRSLERLTTSTTSRTRIVTFAGGIRRTYHDRSKNISRTPPKPSTPPQEPESTTPGLLSIQDLLSGHQPKKAPAETSPAQTSIKVFGPRLDDPAGVEDPRSRWRKSSSSRTRPGNDDAAEPKTIWLVTDTSEPDPAALDSQPRHRAADRSPAAQSRLDYIPARSTMKSWAQILTTPTADTPGTTLLLHYDSKRYLFGSVGEGTQRACVQMGARLLKVSECFITGRTEWRNTGGLIGMILTLADAAAASQSNSVEVARKVARLAHVKAVGLECADDPEKVRELEEQIRKEMAARLRVFAPPNLTYMLATARKFVFRKGMPVDVQEIEAAVDDGKGGEADAEAERGRQPTFADENVKVWAISILPDSAAPPKTQAPPPISPRKRSLDELYERRPIPPTHSNGTTATTTTSTAITASAVTPAQADHLTVRAVVAEMFNSSWRLDTLHPTPLRSVRLPAAIFFRDPTTGTLEKYTGALPNAPLKPGQAPADPEMEVLVRKPWPGALVDGLPSVSVRREAVSYILRNHTQRGKFSPERAVAAGVPKGFLWSKLSAGEDVLNTEGETVTPDMVLGASKEGGGIAVLDLPGVEYIGPLLGQGVWRDEAVMGGVGVMVWICGPGVVGDERVRAFMREFGGVEHVVSGVDVCPNHLALDSAAAATVRLAQVDGARYRAPVHDNEAVQGKGTVLSLPSNARVARRGMTIQLEPKVEIQEETVVPLLDIPAIETATSPEVLRLAAAAKAAVTAAAPATQRWADSLPPGAAETETVTLGTGSALPSKYRNVSATLLRVPGWGCMLLDAGENTLGQLKRVFPPDELKEILRELRVIWISHMHADHHLGTVGVVRAWYEEVHSARPLPAGTDAKAHFDTKTGLAIVSESAMLSWLAEYSQVEDYGFSRLAPLYITPAGRGAASTLGWFLPHAVLAAQGSRAATDRLLAAHKVPAGLLNLADVQAVQVLHCHGARAVSVTFPSGFKVSYSGDCRPSQPFVGIGRGSTVCIHEATFDDELAGDARAKNHSTTSEALGVAQGMGARGCVLTHFSQRYQKLPVLEHGAGGALEAGQAGREGAGEPAVEEVEAADDAMDGPLEDGGGEASAPEPAVTADGAPEAVTVKLASDMKVCVAFDYMRVKVGEIPQLAQFTPALLKLFQTEEKEKAAPADGLGDEPAASGKKGGKGKGKKQLKGQRGNA